MAMTMSEMLKAMKEANIDGGSKLHLRSEDLQKKQRVVRIPTLRNALKKKSLLMIETELALPFNPDSGEEDETYNVHNKYRPPFSATSTALLIKGMAAENEALKNKVMKDAGVSDWDLSDVSTCNEEDKKILKVYRVPRIFSISAVRIDIPAMNRGQFGAEYAITINRDEQLNIIGEPPLCVLANKFFRDVAYEEVSEYNADIQSGKIKDTEQQQKEKRSNIYGRVPVSDDHPCNFVLGYEIPLERNGVISADVLSSIKDESDVRKYEVISKYKKDIRLAVEAYMRGDYDRFDKNFDFFEIEMTCPTEGDPNTMQGKAQIGRDTKFDKPTACTRSRDDYYDEASSTYSTDALCNAVSANIDSNVDIETRVRNSMGIRMLDESVEQKMMTSLSTVIDLDNPYITDRVITNNADFLRLALGDEGAEAIDEVEAKVSGRKEGNLDDKESKVEAKKYDLAEMEMEVDESDGSSDSAPFEDFEDLKLAAAE